MDFETSLSELPDVANIKKLSVVQMKPILNKYGIKLQNERSNVQHQLMDLVFNEVSKNRKRDGKPAEEEKNPAKKRKPNPEIELKKDITDQPKTGTDIAIDLLQLVEHHGTKIGHVIFYLRTLWERRPAARVIIFSQVSINMLALTASLMEY